MSSHETRKEREKENRAVKKKGKQAESRSKAVIHHEGPCVAKAMQGKHEKHEEENEDKDLFGKPVNQPEPPRTPIVERLKHATADPMTQVAPGIWVPADAKAVPDLTLAYWIPNEDGTYKLVPFRERMIKLGRKIASILGFPGQYNTLHRLAEAGFIEILKITPQTHMLNLNSWFNHLRRCAEDPEFWDDQRRVKEYRKTYRRVD